jgi:hypothetical protein
MATLVRRVGSGQRRPWLRAREGTDGFYRRLTWRKGISHRGTAAPRPARAQDKAAGGPLDQGWRGWAARTGATRGVRGLQGASGRHWVPWEGTEGLGRRGRARLRMRAGALAGTTSGRRSVPA